MVGLFAVVFMAALSPAAFGESFRDGSLTGPAYTGPVTASNLGGATYDASGLGTVTCSSVSLSGAVTANSPVAGQITSATWSDCANNVGGSCALTAKNLPWDANATWLSGSSTAVNGSFALSEVSPGYVGVHTVCGGSLTCDWGASTLNMSLYNPGSTVAPVSSSDAVLQYNASLSYRGGSGMFFCGSSATFRGTYSLVGTGGGVPHHLYLAQS